MSQNTTIVLLCFGFFAFVGTMFGFQSQYDIAKLKCNAPDVAHQVLPK